MATATEPTTAIVSAVIPLAMRDELEQRAQENDRTLSSEIRRGLRVYLTRAADKQDEPAA
jgi:hypothetical protein